jgi:hypothetical protein
MRVENSLDRGFDLGDGEGLAGGLVERLGVDQELVAQHGLELPGVHFRHQHAVIAAQQLAQVLRHRPDVADVDVADVLPLGTRAAHRLMDRAEGRPQPTTASLPPACRGHVLIRNAAAMPSTLALRRSVIAWWLAGE